MDQIGQLDHRCIDRAFLIVVFAANNLCMGVRFMDREDRDFFYKFIQCPRCCLLYADALEDLIEGVDEGQVITPEIRDQCFQRLKEKFGVPPK